MNKSLSIFFFLILVAVFTVSVLAAGTPHVPKGSGIPSHGLHSDGGVQPESFNYMDLSSLIHAVYRTDDRKTGTG